jgi:hypothetical protein
VAISADVDVAMAVTSAADEEEVAPMVVIGDGVAAAFVVIEVAASVVIEVAASVVIEVAASVAIEAAASVVIEAAASVAIAAEAFVVDGVDSRPPRCLGKLHEGDFECCTDGVSAMAATYRSPMLKSQSSRMSWSKLTYLKPWHRLRWA